MKNSSTRLIGNNEELLRYLKSRTHAYHLSNLFFRDFHYAILSFAETKGQRVSYGDAEELAGLFIASMEKDGILKPIKPGSWMLNYPEFKKVSVKPAAPVHSGSAASSAAKTAADATTSA